MLRSTGHHVPTDSPWGHLILLVQATSGQRQSLPLLEGSTVPEWGGREAGLPSKAYAGVLGEL